MILALRTGWTPDVIGGDAPGGLTAGFRRACHAALYAERLSPVLDEYDALAAATPPKGATASELAAIGGMKVTAANRAAEIRGHLFPEDDPADG